MALAGIWGAAAYGQLLEVNGGASSLYQSQGGSILLHGSAYEGEVGAGVIAGRLVAGGRVAYREKDTIYSAGVEEIRFNLPTDLFNTDHRLLGLGVDRKSTRPGRAMEVFAGGTSQRFDTPLFTGVRVDQPAAAVVLQHSLSANLVATTQMLAASSSTALEGLQWSFRPWLKLAAAGGFGGKSRYEAFSADVERPLVDLKAAYIDAPRNFQRLGSNPGISPEPIHENLLFTIRSSARNPVFTVAGGRQNFMAPLSTGTGSSFAATANLISTSNQITTSTSFKAFALTGTAIKSAYDGDANLAFVLSASAAPSQRLRIQTSYLQSRLLRQQTQPQAQIQIQTQTQTITPATDTVVTSLQESVTRRYGLNQTITRSNGQTSVGYGGSIFSNFISVSADYETFYIPTRLGNPFQQTLIVDLSLSLFGRLTLHGGSFVSPTGKLLYTANAHAVQGRSPATLPGGDRMRFGLYIVQGRVVDTNGDPLPGAAISIGANVLFTDSAGEFFLRDKKPRSYSFQVLGDQFLDGHTYGVVSQPALVPGIKAEEQHLLIVVKRIADQQAEQQETGPCVQAHRGLGRHAEATGQASCEVSSSPPQRTGWQHRWWPR